MSLSLGAVSAVWKNPKYLHSELHFNVLVVSADLTGRNRSDVLLGGGDWCIVSMLRIFSESLIYFCYYMKEN